MILENSSQPEIAETFPKQGTEVLRRLRTSIAEMVNTLPGKVRVTRDLQKHLGIDAKLCWQVMKVAGPGDALSLAPFVPTPGPMRKLVSAAIKSGIAREVVDEVKAAYDAFEELVVVQAGDRTTFDSMATSAATGGSDDDLYRAALQHRKAAFKTHSHYCGTQLETHLRVSMLHPASAPAHFDFVSLSVQLGLRRLRADAGVIVERFKTARPTDLDSFQDDYQHDFFDPGSARITGAPVIGPFCTQPLPSFQTSRDSDGRTFISLTGDAVGHQSVADLVFGQKVPNLRRFALPGQTRAAFGQAIAITTPTVRFILDQLVHRASTPILDYRFSVNWLPTRVDPSGQDRGPALPFREKMTKLEGGVDGARIREIPRYNEMIEYVCNQVKWRVEDFDVYRVQVEYPLLHTRLWADFETEAPADQ